MMTCAICNLAMEVGDGKPMFTAECSHCFHFLCVVSNAKGGSQTCIICQTKWKVNPLQGSAPTSTNPLQQQQRLLSNMLNPSQGTTATILFQQQQHQRIPNSALNTSLGTTSTIRFYQQQQLLQQQRLQLQQQRYQQQLQQQTHPQLLHRQQLQRQLTNMGNPLQGVVPSTNLLHQQKSLVTNMGGAASSTNLLDQQQSLVTSMGNPLQGVVNSTNLLHQQPRQLINPGNGLLNYAANWESSHFQLGAILTDLSHKRVRTNMEAYHPSVINAPLLGNLGTLESNVLGPRSLNFGVNEDSLDSQPQFTSNSSPYIDIKTYPEMSAVQRSMPKENFSVLINLKVLVTDIKQDNDDEHMPQSCRAPVDLVTVLDVSGSMRGSKIELLKRAMRFVIENLGHSDRLSIVTFSTYANQLLPLRRMNVLGKQHALSAVNSLATGSGTHILNGLRMGASVIDSRKEKNPFCSIMLLSDGKDTSNDTTRLQKSLTMIKVPLHTFGFGSCHDPVLLHSISEGCKGTFSFIEAEGFIQDAFAQCIGGLLSVVLQDVQVHVQSVHPDIRIGSLNAGSYSVLLTDENQTGFIDVGDLYENEEKGFLISLNVPTVGGEDSSTETELVNVGCIYKDPFSKQVKSTTIKKVKIQRPEIVEEGFVVVPIEVDQQKCRLRATKAMSESRDAAEKGDLSSAWSILESCQKDLSETTSARTGNQLCAALDSELKEIRSRMENMQIYESSGRAYVLSGISSHSGQRATTRGDTSSDSSGFVRVYQTKSMENMVTKSHTTG